MIETENLTKTFGDVTAVDALTLQVDEGEVFGLLGPNGAGKTTTVRILSCLISPTSGTARINGYDVGTAEDDLKIRNMIGVLPENVGLYEELSAYRNLDFYARLYGVPLKERQRQIQELLTMLGLWDRRDAPVGTFSKGMKQKIAIARAVVHDPTVLFLDEPTANLDPEASKTVRDFILELKRENRTIFLNTHRLDEADRICDRIGVLKTKLLAVGTPEQLRQSLWGTKTVVQLGAVTDEIVAAVSRVAPGKVEVSGDRRSLVITVNRPGEQNPEIVDAIVRAGGRIESIAELRPALEDVYLKIVRGQA